MYSHEFPADPACEIYYNIMLHFFFQILHHLKGYYTSYHNRFIIWKQQQDILNMYRWAVAESGYGNSRHIDRCWQVLDENIEEYCSTNEVTIILSHFVYYTL